MDKLKTGRAVGYKRAHSGKTIYIGYNWFQVLIMKIKEALSNG